MAAVGKLLHGLLPPREEQRKVGRALASKAAVGSTQVGGTQAVARELAVHALATVNK